MSELKLFVKKENNYPEYIFKNGCIFQGCKAEWEFSKDHYVEYNRSNAQIITDVDDIMTFGKMKGNPFSNLSPSYKVWLLKRGYLKIKSELLELIIWNDVINGGCSNSHSYSHDASFGQAIDRYTGGIGF